MAERPEEMPAGLLGLVAGKSSRPEINPARPMPLVSNAVADPTTGVERRDDRTQSSGLRAGAPEQPADRKASSPAPKLLEDEIAFFRQHIDELMQFGEGRYVLIVGKELIGDFDGLEAAANYSIEHFGRRAVLIKRLTRVETVHTLGGVDWGSRAGSA